MDRIKKKSTTEPFSVQKAEFTPHSDQCTICCQSYKRLHHDLIKSQIDAEFIKNGFIKCRNLPIHERVFFKTNYSDGSISTPLTITVSEDMSWECCVFGTAVDKANSSALKDIPQLLSGKNIIDITHQFGTMKICPGNLDFNDILEKRVDFKEPFLSSDGSCAAWVESSHGHSKLIRENFDIIRHRNCQYLIVEGDMCESCKQMRKNLFSARLRLADDHVSEQRASDMSTTNLRYLSVSELSNRLQNAQKSKREAIRKATRLAVMVGKIVQQEGVSVSAEQHNLFEQVLKNNAYSEFDEGSPQWLLWQQQREQAAKCNSSSMRWHPLIIRWCLSVYLTSPAGYKQMASKKNKFLVLPHVNTLKKYINFTAPSTGFNPDIIDRLIEDINVGSLKDFQRNVSLVFDEMKIKADLVFNRATGKLVGFTEMGSINEEINMFQARCNGEKGSDDRDFARYINMFMVRGIFTNLSYPFGYHASMGFTADQLFPLVWEATRVLEVVGLNVRAWVCDGASPNRKLFKLNRISEEEEDYYWTWNLFDPTRKIYFMSDVPHLMKTTRNNLENSHGNLNTRNLHVSMAVVK